MFIKVTRSDTESKIQMIVAFARIKAVYEGYESIGSRLLVEGGADEIQVQEDIDEIWQMMKGWQK